NTRGEAGVVAIFIGRIAEGKPCIIYGDGKQTRDYIYIGDVVEANYRALSSPVGIYNIGTSKETSVNELVEIFSQILNSRVERVYEKPRTGELFRNSLDINLARKELNWQPKIDIFQGIRLTYEYFNQNRE
ncbi:MAG: GDP-mannose 4,6-dehydratase, partial [candidate division WOR-3 bacterium]